MKEPLHPSKVKTLLAKILAEGKLSFSSHAYDEMRKDNLHEVDVRNTLKGGMPEPGELQKGDVALSRLHLEDGRGRRFP